VPLDYTEAAKWTRQAAEQGLASAQLDLAYLYEQGKGLPLDYIAAYMWYKSAADRGEKPAQARLKSLSTVMSRAQIQCASAAAGQLHTPVSPESEDSSSDIVGKTFTEHR
jgi:TPR repeat protein